jgi:hypothetical protein
MKKLSPILFSILLLASACTTTQYKDFKRTSLLQKTDIGEITVKPDGTIILKGYANDGGGEAVNGIVRSAVEGAVRGAKPGP